jgi:hypothetical protein
LSLYKSIWFTILVFVQKYVVRRLPQLAVSSQTSHCHFFFRLVTISTKTGSPLEDDKLFP